jgi:hypothetical protein
MGSHGGDPSAHCYVKEGSHRVTATPPCSEEGKTVEMVKRQWLPEA